MKNPIAALFNSLAKTTRLETLRGEIGFLRNKCQQQQREALKTKTTKTGNFSEFTVKEYGRSYNKHSCRV